MPFFYIPPRKRGFDMAQTITGLDFKIREMAFRIRELRQIEGLTTAEMATKTDISEEDYISCEEGTGDLTFAFIYRCALALGVDVSDIIEGSSPRLNACVVTRRGQGQQISEAHSMVYYNLAAAFRNRIADPLYVISKYDEENAHRDIELTTHTGQECDIVIEGHLKVQVGEHIAVLGPGDSIYYDSSTPHGMIAVDGRDCLFYAIVLNIAEKAPDKTAMVHISKDKTERRFTFLDMKYFSARCANYFRSLGIKKGDRVMLVLKRHYQFWGAMLGLNKLGAIAILATNQLLEHDFEYRFNAAGISAILCTADGDTAHQAELAAEKCPQLKTKIIVNGKRDGWRDFDEEYIRFSKTFERTEDSPCGDDPLLMFFTSGTTGYPKAAVHNHKYPLGHFHTAKFWHCVDPDGLHLTISDTGWAKAMWGKLYGQWLCEAATFVYDFDRFDAADILPMFAKYHITTFCAPPTMLRMMIKEDLSKYDFSSVKHMSTAGEALNPEVYYQFEKLTGLKIMDGFGQSETTQIIGNLVGDKFKIGSMGKPAPIYKVDILSPEGKPVGVGETGEICIDVSQGAPCGLFTGYYGQPDKTAEVWHDGYYHTRDVAWRDEDGFFWYVGRVDDVIKSSGYRIGPFEIESVIMELPFVLECGVSAAPDPVRGQVVKASIVLTKGTEGTEDLKKEIQNYVKHKTAPYKYPRIVEFKDELPKTVSGKIIRHLL